MRFPIPWLAVLGALGCSAKSPTAEVDGGGSGTADAAIGDGGLVSCPQYPGAVFCDDFEHDTPATLAAELPLATVSDNTPPTTPVSATAYSGTHVLATDTVYVSQPGGYSLVSRPLPTLLGTQGVRVAISVWFATQADAVGSFNYDLSMSGTEPGGLAGVELEIGTTLAENQLTLVYDPSNPTSPGSMVNVPLLIGQWMRFDVDITLGPDDASRRVDVSINGVAQPPFAFTNQPADYAGTYTGSWTFGAYAYQANPTSNIAFDDAVIWQH